MYFKVEYLLRGKRDNLIVKANNRVEASALAKKEKQGIVVVKVKESATPIDKSFENFIHRFSFKFNK